LFKSLGSSRGRRSRRWAGYGGVVTVAVLIAAGCSSSSKSSSGTTNPAGSAAGSATTTGQAATGTPIVVGNVGALTSAIGQSQPDDKATPSAWVSYTNAHGGIAGHPVKLIQMDDQGDPAKALADVEQLINQDHVVALVGDQDSSTDTAYASVLTSSGVPNVGGADFSTIWYQNPDYFPTMATENTNSYALDYAAKLGGAKVFTVAYCSENPACLEGEQGEAAVAPTVGITYIKGPATSSVAPNYTAQCVTMMAHHPDAIAFADTTQTDEKMATDCAQQGYKGFWVLFQPDDTELKTPALAKFSIGEDLQLPYFAQLPATQTFRQAMATYAPGVPLQIDSLRIWAAFDVFKAAVEAEKGQAITPQAVKTGLYSLQGFNDNGIIPPLHFKEGQPTNNSCFMIWEIKDGQFALPNGDTYTCAKS
jgi:branched-chain amino acid transport system substrate-binding protein